MDQEESKAYRWEGGYERTWEALREDDSGKLVSDASASKRKTVRARLAAKKGTKLDLIRNCVVVLDLSKSMNDPDFRIEKYPNRGAVAIRGILEFIPLFFSSSPLGRIGVVCLKNRRAERLVPLGASPNEIRTKLTSVLEKGPKCEGECSMVNGIKLCTDMLNSAGQDASKEIIFLLGALSTIDPDGPHEALDMVKINNIRCSVVSLSAEVKIWKDLTQVSDGNYFVPLDVHSISEKLEILARPPKDTAGKQATLMRMGFPINEGKNKYVCPQCRYRVTALPTTCPVCRLPLVSAPHLARSYHHLFPPPNTIPHIPDDIPEDERDQTERELFNLIQPCIGCGETANSIEEGKQFVYCELCRSSLCQLCDILIDDNIHSCPGCS